MSSRWWKYWADKCFRLWLNVGTKTWPQDDVFSTVYFSSLLWWYLTTLVFFFLLHIAGSATRRQAGATAAIWCAAAEATIRTRRKWWSAATASTTGAATSPVRNVRGLWRDTCVNESLSHTHTHDPSWNSTTYTAITLILFLIWEFWLSVFNQKHSATKKANGSFFVFIYLYIFFQIIFFYIFVFVGMNIAHNSDQPRDWTILHFPNFLFSQ